MSIAVNSDVRQIEAKNFRHLVWDVFWFALALGSTDQFLRVYAIRLGATTEQLNLMAALPALVLAVATMFSLWYLKLFPNAVRATYWAGLGFRFMFFLPALVAFLPRELQMTGIIVAVILPSIAQGLAAATFIIVMRQAVRQELLASLLSWRSLALNVPFFISTAIYGTWLEHAVFPYNYQVMFLVAFLCALISLYYLIDIKIPVAPVPEPAPVSPGQKASLLTLLKKPAFLRLMVIAGMTHLAYAGILPVITEHLTRNLGAAEGFIRDFSLVTLVAGVAVSLVSSRIVRRIGTRASVALGMYGVGIAALIIAFAPNLQVTLLAAALSGAAWTLGAVVALFGFFVENTAGENNEHSSVIYYTVLAVGMFIGPMLGNVLASSGMSLPAIILAGAGARLFSGLLTSVWTGNRPSAALRAQPRAAAGD